MNERQRAYDQQLEEHIKNDSWQLNKHEHKTCSSECMDIIHMVEECSIFYCKQDGCCRCGARIKKENK